MLNPINGPASPSQGPATGDSTEHDSWSSAVAKINGMFRAIYARLEGPIEHEVSVVDEEARDLANKLVAELSEHVTALEKRFEALEALVMSTIKSHV